MLRAFMDRDPEFDGVFFTGVKTTGIFCRCTCHARKPLRENIEFFPTAHEALVHGYRPCKVCTPLAASGKMPEWVRVVLDDVHARPSRRVRDQDLRTKGVDPVRLRRWFNANLGMTFHDYCRSLRVGRGLSAISGGETTTGAAFDSGYESLSGFGEAVRGLAGLSPSAAGDSAPVFYSRLSTPLGSMIAAATESRLLLLEFADRRGLDGQMQTLGRRVSAAHLAGRTEIHDRIEEELTHYFAGSLTEFSVPVATPGTPFQQQVWRSLTDIPYGSTRSYADQARMVGRPEAVRAVARANGRKQACDCHSVPPSGGSGWAAYRLRGRTLEKAAVAGD
jgi:AraC family transcriptional regulator of adaptative response/methylated-DNA-[protein]-cysteine methyltransferase